MQQGNNDKVIDSAIDHFIQQTVIPQAIEGFSRTADEILAWIEGNTGGVLGEGDIPIQYGNLRDSVGLAIYANGIMQMWKPNPIAQVPSDYNDRDIWGREWLQYAIYQAAKQFDDGNVYLVAFAAVPYAQDVEERTGFFENYVVQTIIRQAFPNLKQTIES